MRHLRLVSAAVGFVLLALVPQSVGAATPLRFPGSVFSGSFVPGTDNEVCPFQVDTGPVDVKVVVTVYFDSQGTPIKLSFTGLIVVFLTNHGTGKTLIVNASGPGFEYLQPDGSALAYGGGPGLIGLTPRDEGGPRLLLIMGHETFNVAPDNRISNLQTVGVVTDMCAALAG